MKLAAQELSTENPIFLGKRAETLSALIEAQIAPIFERQGIVVPVRSCSLLLQVERAGSASAADLAKALGQSHQLVLQKIPTLLELQLIERRQDPKDGRRRIFSLSEKGVQQTRLLDEHAETITRLYRELYEEIGVDLFSAIGRALEALESRSLADRLRDG